MKRFTFLFFASFALSAQAATMDCPPNILPEYIKCRSDTFDYEKNGKAYVGRLYSLLTDAPDCDYDVCISPGHRYFVRLADDDEHAKSDPDLLISMKYSEDERAVGYCVQDKLAKGRHFASGLSLKNLEDFGIKGHEWIDGEFWQTLKFASDSPFHGTLKMNQKRVCTDDYGYKPNTRTFQEAQALCESIVIEGNMSTAPVSYDTYINRAEKGSGSDYYYVCYKRFIQKTLLNTKLEKWLYHISMDKNESAEPVLKEKLPYY